VGSGTLLPMRLVPFEMERLQSIWENQVAWNLSESGVEPLRLEELAVTGADREAVMRQPLGYTQTNGTRELRMMISSMYRDAAPENVDVTNGGSEANFITLMHLLEPGDEVVLMTPNYMQAPGVAAAFGARVTPWPLRVDQARTRWAPDLRALEALAGGRTKVIFICTPNNPTGARMTSEELDGICAIARRQGAWVVSDEIYRGAEMDGVETPSAWGRYERVIVTSGLSKAYGLPGLRIGWVVGPPKVVEALWGVHDYTTIAPGALSDRLARIALSPGGRERLLARTQGIIRANYPIVKRWLQARSGMFDHVAPEAGAIALLRYHFDINSSALVQRLREEQSVLIVPGDHFLMDRHLRIGFGSHPEHLVGALERIALVMDKLPAHAR
jgi:aspartate/methionine/tyrosine aminotransferase